MKLLAIVIALAVVALIATKTLGHHTTCTTKFTSTGGSVYAPGTNSTSCTRSPGLW